MTIVASFPSGTFQNTIEALKFIKPVALQLSLDWISSDESFEGGYSQFNFLQSVYAFEKNNDKSFTLSSENTKHHDEKNKITYRENIFSYLTLFWMTFEEDNFELIHTFISNISKINFSTVCKFNFQKARWQSEEFVANFIYEKKPYGHLNTKIDPNLPPDINEMIDIKLNPGHYKETYNMFLMAAPEIWFGKKSLDYFDEYKILTFEGAKKIEKNNEGVVYINLFDWKEVDYEASEILEIQKKFRDWVGMDELELQLDNLALTEMQKKMKKFL